MPTGRTTPSGAAGLREFTDALVAFLAAARRTRGRLQPVFTDISVPQMLLLAAVEEVGEEGVTAVAEHVGLRQPTVTRGIVALEKRGLVRRVTCRDDRRGVLVRLTAAGQELLDAKRRAVDEQVAAAWGQMTTEERRLAARLMRNLTELVEHLA